MTMTLDELRLWQMGNQHLLSPVDMRAAARDLCGVQAQFLGNAYTRCGSGATRSRRTRRGRIW